MAFRKDVLMNSKNPPIIQDLYIYRIQTMLKRFIHIPSFIQTIDLLAIQFKDSCIQIMTLAGNVNYESFDSDAAFALNWTPENLTKSLVVAKKVTERKHHRWGNNPLLSLRRVFCSSMENFKNLKENQFLTCRFNYQFPTQKPSSPLQQHNKHGGHFSFDKKANQVLCRSVVQRIQRENVQFLRNLISLTNETILGCKSR